MAHDRMIARPVRNAAYGLGGVVVVVVLELPFVFVFLWPRFPLEWVSDVSEVVVVRLAPVESVFESVRVASV